MKNTRSVLPKSPIAQATAYALRHWQASHATWKMVSSSHRPCPKPCRRLRCRLRGARSGTADVGLLPGSSCIQVLCFANAEMPGVRTASSMAHQ
jgi:hypothetical protein